METATQHENEKAIIADVCRGSGDAFRVLFDAHSRKIYRLALRILKNHEDAEDVMQTTMMKAYSKMPQFRGDSQFNTWLLRIAFNEALMKVRKRHAANFIGFDELSTMEVKNSLPLQGRLHHASRNPEKELLATELLNAAVGDPDSSLGTALLLHHVEGLTIREMAQVLRISASAAKSRLLRARQKAKKALRLVFVPAQP
ncbi:MAG: RNA polymerase sigma factor [Terriglobia bacterium]